MGWRSLHICEIVGRAGEQVQGYRKGGKIPMIRILLYSAATTVFAVSAFIYPERRYLYLFFVVLGISGIIRGYRGLAPSSSGD